MAKEIGGYTAAEWSILCLSSLGILQIVFALTEWNNCPAIPGLNLMTLLAGAFAVPIAFAVHFTRGNSPEYMEKQDMRIGTPVRVKFLDMLFKAIFAIWGAIIIFPNFDKRPPYAPNVTEVGEDQHCEGALFWMAMISVVMGLAFGAPMVPCFIASSLAPKKDDTQEMTGIDP